MYTPKNNDTMNRQLKVQRLVLPFVLTANATPASKTHTNDAPSLLHLKFEGTGQDYTTTGNGGFDTSAEATAVTFATSSDANGVFSALIRVGEQVSKVISCRCIRRGVATGENVQCTFPTGATSGITSLGDKIVVDFDSAVNFATTNYDAVIEVQYTVAD
jgi:hypothetical protein